MEIGFKRRGVREGHTHSHIEIERGREREVVREIRGKDTHTYT